MVARNGAPPPLPSAESLDLPESFSYRVKKVLLGPPLVSDQLSTERLGKPTALAVLSSDVMSSSAYATEQILTVLVGAAGVAAFSLIVPITLAILVVILFVTLSYLDVIKAYPKAGGAYVVTRENFGPRWAQLASAALLIGYTLTVAVSVSAGVAALTSAFPVAKPATVPIAVGFVLLIAYVNLRGIREAGRSFAVPTFAFIANMGVLILVGVVKELTGGLHHHPIHVQGAVPVGTPGHGLLLGVGLFFVLRAFASGGTALTGTEAISNGVSIFRRPEARNARITLAAMSLILGSMFLGVSLLSAWTHAVPHVGGTPSVLSQLADHVYGTSAIGRALFYLLDIATLVILVLAANTSFTGFPYLASFAAEDSFLPRQLMRRGHRLVFSNGIIVLTVLAVALILATGANITSLIALYAIGVFTGFTLAGAGMTKHHLSCRGEHWRRGVATNACAAVLAFAVDIIFVVTKFTQGAWVVVLLMPLLVLGFVRLNRQYRGEAEELEENAPLAGRAPVLRRHVVLVLVDRLDLATARAIQYARTLSPDELRAVHFVVDPHEARTLGEDWELLNLRRLPLETIDCPDRRLSRAALELVAETVADNETEVTVLLPRRAYLRQWSRLLHDRTADRIAAVVGQLPHANATIVPYQLSPAMAGGHGALRRPAPAPSGTDGRTGAEDGDVAAMAGTVQIGRCEYRRRARVAGKVTRTVVVMSGESPNFVVRLEDQTGGISLVFAGRRNIPGLELGTKVVAEGMVAERNNHLAIFNPDYEPLASPDADYSGPT